MKLLLLPVALVLPLLASIALLAQQPSPIRVCVVGRDTLHGPMFSQQLNSTPQIRYQRDSIVKYVNQHKSPANSSVTVEAVALQSTGMATLTADADAAGCSYLVTVTSSPVPSANDDPRDNHANSYDLSGGGLPPPAPLNFSIMRREPAGWWNGLPDGSYNSSKWFAQAIADEAYATILKHPTP